MRKTVLLFVWVFATLLSKSLIASESEIKTTPVESLRGTQLQFPDLFGKENGWIVIGFSKGSQKAITRCYAKLDGQFPKKGYSAAVLEGAPFFLKGIIKNAIRSEVPENLQDRYLIFNDLRDELKRIARYKEEFEKDAYLIGIGPSGKSPRKIQGLGHDLCENSSNEFSILTKSWLSQ